MNNRFLATFAIAMSTCLGGPAGAAIISGTYTVAGSNFFPSGASPYASITESFTITFDNAITVSQQTTGISLNPSSTIAPASPLAFTYFTATDTLIVGGTSASVSTSDPASVDFALVLANASHLSAFVPVTLSYSVGRNAVYTASTVTRVDAAPGAVPEPGTLASITLGAVALAALRRRRARNAAAA